MTSKHPAPVVPSESGVTEPSSAWSELAGLTPARIALGRSGVSLPTREVLSFGLAHARARDAVHAELDVPKLREALERDGWTTLEAASDAPTRAVYLARPDQGRRLDAESRERLSAQPRTGADLAFVLGDGLSAFALQRHAAPLLAALRPRTAALRIASLVIARQARVALADEIGELLGVRVVAHLIGERPGLSSPDSLGVYLTASPRVGCSDADRNCISNIHAAGASYETAAAQIATLIEAALKTGRTGVALAQRVQPALSAATGPASSPPVP